MSRRTSAQAAVATMASRLTFAIALFAVAASFGLAAPRLHAQSANTDYKRGQAAEAREDYDAAFDLYQKAYNRDPTDARFKIALARVRVTASSVHVSKGRKLAQAGDLQGALSEFLHAAEIDPANEAAQQEIARLRKQGAAAPAPEVGLPEPTAEEQELESVQAPPELKPLTNEPLSLHMAEDAKVVYEAIGKAAGVNVLFDPDYNSKRIQVDLNNVSLLDALRIVGVMSNTFWRPVTSNTIFIAQNSRTKRQELDEEAVQTFYLTNAWQQNDLNDVQTALRNVMPNAKVYGVQSQNAIVMRGTPDELLLAQQLIDDLDKPRGEVVVDIAVLEVSKNWEKTLGISWPSSIGVALQPNCAATGSCSSSSSTSSTTGTTSTTTTSPTLYTLANLNSTDFALSIGSATLNLLLTDNNTKVLQSPRIRATDAQKATMKIGSRIPIATGSYSAPGITATTAIGYAQTQFQYQDVGVNIEMTPSIHYDHDVTLKIKIEVSAESGTETIEGVTEPIISQRVVDQTIRLREGEASILGGIENKQEQNNWNGIPGLSAIPILKYIFGSRDRQIQDDDIVFVVVPHIVRSQELDQANLRVIDTGEGQSIDLRHTDQGAAAAPAPAARPTALEQPAVGTAPAQSAIEAAPAMLAELRAAAAANASPATTAQATTPPPNPVPAAAPQPAVPPPSTAPIAPPAASTVPAASAPPQAAVPSPSTAPVAPPAPSTVPASSALPQAAALPPSAAPVASPAPPIVPATTPLPGATPAQTSGAPALPTQAQPAPAAATVQAASPAASPGGVSFALNAPATPPAAGATFQLPVVLSGGTDIASIALQMHYDASKLMLVNVSGGDFLSRDGQAAPPIHADEPPGNLVVGISRPPGTHGVSGTGVVCVLTFQAKASGPSNLTLSRASVVNSAQQQLPVGSAQVSIIVK